MGLWTLADFRTRMQAALGNFAYTNTLVDLWINAGVQEVAGAVDFDALDARTTLTFVQGTRSYAGAADMIRPISIGWPNNDRWLIKASRTRLDSLRQDTQGIPKMWTWEDRNIIVWPTPDAATVAAGTATVLYVQQHPALSASGDKTLFGATWDNAVHYFGVAAAMLDLGDDERAIYWLDRATKYAGSRITDAEYGSEAISAPVRLLTDGEELYKQSSR